MEKPSFLNKAQQNILLFIFTLAPVISIFGGLIIAAFFIVIGLIPLILLIRDKQHQLLYYSLPAKLCLILLAWMALSLLWSIRPDKSLSWCTRITAIYIGYISLIYYFKYISEEFIIKLHKYTFLSLCISLIIYAFELISGGTITQFIRIDILAKTHYIYFPHDMNRGATFTALCAWPVLYYLHMQHRNHLYTTILWALIFFTLINLESLAATAGYAIGSLALLCIICLRNYARHLILLGVAFVFIIIPITMSMINPHQVINSHPQIPVSAQHRLHIWSFSADKAQEQALIGKGLGSSKYIEKHKSDWPGENIDPLPSHPHNVIMQVWLELGVIGLIFYATLVLAILLSIFKNKNLNFTTQAFATSYIISFLTISATAYNGWQSWWIGSFLMLSLFYFKPLNITETHNQPKKTYT